MSNPRKTAVIIGGGLGGLAASIRLAARGWRVTLCEQGPALGGKMNRLQAGGFTFDTGPSLITMRWVFEELFAAAGKRIEDYLSFTAMRPLARYCFDDGVQFTYSSSLPEWLDTVRSIEPRDVDGFFRFLRLGARIFELSKATFLRRPPSSPPDLEALRALRHFPLRHAWGNYHKAVAAHFRSPHLRQLYDRYPTYVGSSPYCSPATLLVIPYIEFAFGGWYADGGLYRIVESLAQIARELGVDLRTVTPVSRILHRGSRVEGVETGGGERIAADVVIMNGDASLAPQLLGDAPDTTLTEGRRSMSGLVFLWGVRRSLSELHHHTVYFSRDYPGEFRDLFGARRFPEDPTVYVSAPSRSDRSLVPGEGEALFVMANAPANDKDEWNDNDIAAARARVLARLHKGGFPAIEGDVAEERVWTPRQLAQRYTMPGGAIYGTHSHGWKNAFLRPPNQDKRYGGLYYVGGSTHPGGGTPTVLLSAAMTSELIRSNEGA
ncbi:MAG: phytoene desaturase [Candidatus Hydrogenedentes bacterium]|nr:phytoene desaturase [Candidatus Hydrogenedentota bacterium]